VAPLPCRFCEDPSCSYACEPFDAEKFAAFRADPGRQALVASILNDGARIAYADPPYPGQSKKHYGDHEDYAGEVDHDELAERLTTFDGWVLHTSSPALFSVQQSLARVGVLPMDDKFKSDAYRVMAWVKPFAAFKRNVSVAYAWEPVLVKPCRKPVVAGRMVMRDYIAEGITMKRGLTGAKPDAVCRWAFEVVGAQQTDVLVDLFPGSGAVTRAWQDWSTEARMFTEATA
jgi:hypothetical protein